MQKNNCYWSFQKEGVTEQVPEHKHAAWENCAVAEDCAMSVISCMPRDYYLAIIKVICGDEMFYTKSTLPGQAYENVLVLWKIVPLFH